MGPLTYEDEIKAPSGIPGPTTRNPAVNPLELSKVIVPVLYIKVESLVVTKLAGTTEPTLPVGP